MMMMMMTMMIWKVDLEMHHQLVSGNPHHNQMGNVLRSLVYSTEIFFQAEGTFVIVGLPV